MDLFREQVYEAHARKRFGRIGIKPPKVVWAAICAIILSIGLGAVVLIVSPYTEYVEGVGSLMPAHGVSDVVASRDGRVVSLKVREGQGVKAGASLVEVSAELSSPQIQDVSLRKRELIEMRAYAVEGAANEVVRSLREEQSHHKGMLESKSARMRLLESAITVQKQRITAAQDQLRRFQDVGDGVVSKIQISQQLDQVFAQVQQGTSLEQDKLTLNEEIIVARRELNDLESRLRKAIFDAQSSVAEVQAEVASLSYEKTMTYVAPVDGVVAAVATQVGAQVDPKMRLLTIVPADSSLIAEVWLDAASASRVQVGSFAMIRLVSRSRQQARHVQGRLRSVSAAPYSDRVGPDGETGAALYRAQIEIDGEDAAKARVVIGEDVSAKIAVRDGSLLGWIVDGAVGRGAR